MDVIYGYFRSDNVWNKQIVIKMKALIIAAGQGKRLRPIGDTKPLVTLLGLGLIERVILTASKILVTESLRSTIFFRTSLINLASSTINTVDILFYVSKDYT